MLLTIQSSPRPHIYTHLWERLPGINNLRKDRFLLGQFLSIMLILGLWGAEWAWKVEAEASYVVEAERRNTGSGHRKSCQLTQLFYLGSTFCSSALPNKSVILWIHPWIKAEPSGSDHFFSIQHVGTRKAFCIQPVTFGKCTNLKSSGAGEMAQMPWPRDGAVAKNELMPRFKGHLGDLDQILKFMHCFSLRALMPFSSLWSRHQCWWRPSLGSFYSTFCFYESRSSGRKLPGQNNFGIPHYPRQNRSIKWQKTNDSGCGKGGGGLSRTANWYILPRNHCGESSKAEK